MIILSFFLSLNSNHSNNLEIPMPEPYNRTSHLAALAKRDAAAEAEIREFKRDWHDWHGWDSQPELCDCRRCEVCAYLDRASHGCSPQGERRYHSYRERFEFFFGGKWFAETPDGVVPVKLVTEIPF